ncbi:MAG: hypothetical protein LBP59_10320 [Planctomycetaceae bacterium]|jgi:hypothetical protein|nr:hypothetical protein [Planctomycetaceae bacterium]
MRIFTSYYGNRLLRGGDYYLVGISVGKYRFLKVDTYLTIIAPTWEMVKELTDQSVYREAYFKILESVGVNKIRAAFEAFETNKQIVLENQQCKSVKTCRPIDKQANVNATLSTNCLKPVVLLCYEDVSKVGQWCHRRMFAEWWENKTGEIIEELSDKPKAEIKSLFDEG